MKERMNQQINQQDPYKSRVNYESAFTTNRSC